MDSIRRRGCKSALSVILLPLALLLVLSGCQSFSLPSFVPSDASDDGASSSKQIRTIYIQSFTGQNVKTVQEIFFETVSEQDVFTFVELLPENYINLKILRIEVVDYQVWENDETIMKIIEPDRQTDSTPDIIRRRNAMVSMKIALYEAETGRLLLRKIYSQPFQQIYVGREALQEIPEKELELKRLTKLLIFRIMTDFYRRNNQKPTLDLEIGQGHDWISRYLHNLGNDRIKKGIRLANAGDYEKAVWIWQLVLFRPGENEPFDVYIENRASAYHNLGVVYGELQDWLRAAQMFSKANRLRQKLRYAQSWGNSMQKWLDSQRDPSGQIDRIVLQESDKRPLELLKDGKTKVVDKKPKASELLERLEKNDQMLLKPRELWPLEPLLKKTEPTPVIGEPVLVDEMQPILIPEEDPQQDLIQSIEPNQGGLEDNLIKPIPE